MDPLSSHIVLVTANNYEHACQQVEDFFNETLLVRYDRVAFNRKQSYCGSDTDFSATLEEGLECNRKTLDKFITEFGKTGFHTIADLQHVAYGYPSKLLHIITHFLDGFIGIDTYFYNLIDDSHWMEEATEENIASKPEQYWLIHLDGYSETPDKVSLV